MASIASENSESSEVETQNSEKSLVIYGSSISSESRMPSYHLVSDNSQSQEFHDPEILCFGFRKSAFRVILYYLFNVIFLGAPYLIGRWWKNWQVYFKCVPCPLHLATVILIKDDIGDYSVCDVRMDRILSEEKTTFYQNSQSNIYGIIHVPSVVRRFYWHHEMYIWNDQQFKFVRNHGLDNVTCEQLIAKFIGLTDAERLLQRAIYGTNAMDVDVKGYGRLLVEEVVNPFYFFQLFSIVLWCLDEYVYYASCVVGISAVSLAVSVVEIKRQSATLRKMADGDGDTIVAALNSGDEEEMSSRDLVPGDVILIPPEGCVLNCDVVVMSGTCLVNESMLTGECIPVHKIALECNDEPFSVETHKKNVVFCGTRIIQTRYYTGNKIACVVIRTGFNTLKGQLIKTMLYPKTLDFQFYKDAMKFVFLLFGIALMGMTYCLYIYAMRGASWFTMMIRVLDILTIVVPPALPAAMTVGVFYAQSRLKRRQIFCISPQRINFCGKVNLVCFDKTGTLTEEGLEFSCVVPYDTETGEFGESIQDPSSLPPYSLLSMAMGCCHSLTCIDDKIIGDPLDVQMFQASGWKLEVPHLADGGDASRFDLLCPNVVNKGELQIGLVRELEFTPNLARMSMVVKILESPGMILKCKGSPESVLPLCSNAPKDCSKILDSLTIKGYRVIALASKRIEGMSWHQLQRASRAELETDLTFCGFLVMQNNMKSSTAPVIKELLTANIRCVMITGDNILTALSVARECGMIPQSDKVVVVDMTPEGEFKFTLSSHHCKPDPKLGTISQTDGEEPGPSASTPLSNSKQSRYYEDEEAEESAVLLVDNSDGSPHLNERELNENLDVFIDMDQLVPIATDSLATTVLKLQDSNYHFALNGATWNLILEHCDSEIIDRILAKGIVFARMSPDSKQNIVERFQKLGYIVGFCGDGANDCCALKAAHVGISLSEAEASVAAPFTSKISDISCVPHVIREGRCALVTSFGVFKYMALYSMVQFASVLILYTYHTNLADTQFLYIDLGITTCIALLMGRTEAFPRLVARTPMSNLMSAQNIFSIVLQISSCVATQLGAIVYLKSQTWFTPVPATDGDELVTKCWETTTIFSVSCFQYLILAMVFSKGPPFRKQFFSNGILVAAFVVLTVVTAVLCVHPEKFLSHFFDLMSPSPELLSYRLVLLCFPLGNLFLCVFLEYLVTSNQFIKRLGRRIVKKPSPPRYRTILQQLNNDSSWPPIQLEVDP